LDHRSSDVVRINGLILSQQRFVIGMLADRNEA